MTLSNWNANVKGRLPTMSIAIVYSLVVLRVTADWQTMDCVGALRELHQQPLIS